MEMKSRRAKHRNRKESLLAQYALLTAVALGASVSLVSVTEADEQELSLLSSDLGSVLSNQISSESLVIAQETAQEAGREAQVQEDLLRSQSSIVSDAETALSTVQGQIMSVENVTSTTVETAASNLSETETVLKEAGATLTSAQEAVSTATDSVSKHAEVLKQSQELNSEAMTELAVATEKVNSLMKDSNVDELKQNIENETKVVETARETVATTEKALTAAKEAETNYDKAISEAKLAVENAKDNTNSALNNLEESKSNLAVATNKEEVAQKALEEAKKGTITTTTVQVGTETTVKNAEAKVKNGIVTLKVADDGEAVYTNDAYLKAIKKLADGTGTAAEVRQAAQQGYYGLDLTQKGPLYTLPSSSNYDKSSSNSQYVKLKVNDSDTKVYDVFALPEEKIRDLALFYAALVNEMRSKVGNQNYLVVTDESMNSIKKSLDAAFTKFTTRTLNGEFHTAGKDRNTPGLLTNLDEFKGTTNSFRYYSWDFNELQKAGTTTHTTTVSTYPTYENFGEGLKLTMSQLKSHLVHVVGKQLYHELVGNSGSHNGKEARNFEAALAILGLDGKDYNAVGLDLMPASSSSIGGAMDSFPSFFTRLMKSDAPAYENPYMEFIGGETTTTPIYETKETIVVDDKAVQRATDALAEAQVETQVAQTSYEKAKESYDLAKKGLEVAQENLSSIKSGEADIHALEDALAEAQKSLSESEARLEADKAALALAEASELEKIKALENAKFELAQAEDKKAKSDAQLAQDKDYLELATNALKMTKQALEQAETGLKIAQEKQAKAKEHYDSVSEAFAQRDEKLATLYVQLKEAETALEEAKAQEKVEATKLEELKANASNLWSKYLDLKAQYDAQTGNKETQDIADKAKDIVESGDKVVPIVDGAGEVVDVVPEGAIKESDKDGVVLVDGVEHEVLKDGSLKKKEATGEDKDKTSVDKEVSNQTPNTKDQNESDGFKVGSSYVQLPSDTKEVTSSKSVVKAEEVRSLPNTGSLENVALSAIGTFTGMLGLVSAKRRKKG